MSEYTELQKPAHEWLDSLGISYLHIPKGRGGVAQKKMSLGGWPDLIVFMPKGQVKLIEFKTETGRLNQKQVDKFEELYKAGHMVEIVSQLEEFKDIILDS